MARTGWNPAASKAAGRKEDEHGGTLYRVTVGASFGLRSAVCAFLAAAVVVTCSSDPADARWRKKRAASQGSSSSITYNPQYAAIVVDANTSDILHSANADSLRHPASLT